MRIIRSTLDIVRDFVGEKRFALGVQLIEGRNDALDIARQLCASGRGGVADFDASDGRRI